jgi:hypothetical protein
MSLNNNRLPQNKQNDLLDLTGTLNTPRYVCEECGLELLLFPQASQYYPMERGPHYICRQCHQVTDISQHKPPGLDEIKPLDLTAPAFVIVPDDKGDKMVIQQPYDPEPDEDKWLKNIGATLIDKRVTVKSDF